jgi:DNA-binding transcriptional LysR family regulator
VIVRITEGVLDALLEGLEKREMDAILPSLDRRTYDSHLEHEVLFKDDMTIVAGRQHALAARMRVNWSDLFDCPWARSQGDVDSGRAARRASQPRRHRYPPARRDRFLNRGRIAAAADGMHRG